MRNQFMTPPANPYHIEPSGTVDTRPGRHILQITIGVSSGWKSSDYQDPIRIISGDHPDDIYIRALNAHMTAIVRSVRIIHDSPINNRAVMQVLYDVYPSRWSESSYRNVPKLKTVPRGMPVRDYVR